MLFYLFQRFKEFSNVLGKMMVLGENSFSIRISLKSSK